MNLFKKIKYFYNNSESSAKIIHNRPTKLSNLYLFQVQLRSPGDPTGRPRSPRSMLAAAAAAAGGSMGPPSQSAHHHHRTLPGRGGQSRGQMMGGGSLQYHQDLAYFDNRRGRMDPPPPPPVQQDNKNNFVREWVAVSVLSKFNFGYLS